MKTLIYLIFAAFLITSCNSEMEEEITWNLDKYPNRLVVEGSVTNELKQQTVKLGLTSSYFDNRIPPVVRNAIVTVSDGINTYTFSESEIKEGFYTSDIEFAGVPLKTYTLQINLPEAVNGVSEYTASSTMPEGIDLDTILCEIYAMPELQLPTDEELDSTILGLYYFGNEPANPENYYMARIYANDIPWQINAKEFLLFSDDYINGNNSDFLLYTKNVADGDLIRFKIISIEKTFYDYILGIQQIDQTGSAYSMSGPPANAVGNIKNASGFFSAAYVSEKTSHAIDKRNQQ